MRTVSSNAMAEVAEQGLDSHMAEGLLSGDLTFSMDDDPVLARLRQVKTLLLEQRNLTRPVVDAQHTVVKRMFSYGEPTRKPLWDLHCHLLRLV